MRGDFMERFMIPSTPPTTNKTIRFPDDVINAVEDAIRNKNCTFSAFVIEAVRVALRNLQEEEAEQSSGQCSTASGARGQ